MLWGWECRQKLLKQIPAKPSESRKAAETLLPGPGQYEPPNIFCGNGYSKIKRAPAYTMGLQTPVSFSKAVVTRKAPMFDVSGQVRTGRYRIPQGIVTPHIEPPRDPLVVPGPGAYAAQHKIQYKRPPAFSIRPGAKPLYQPWDMWTPPPNMYLPPIPCKKMPAYSFGNPARKLKDQKIPGPGEHNPNFNFVKKTKPAFGFGAPFRPRREKISPAPNAYCEKKFMVGKRNIPAPSFGIRHSPYIGKQAQYLIPSNLNVAIKGS